MKRDLLFRTLAVTGLLTLALGAVPATAGFSSQEVVGSKYDNKVQTKDGSCVRTKWQTGNDACGTKKEAPPPPPVVYEAPPPPPRPVVKAPPPPPAPVVRTVIKEDARTIYFDSGKSVITPGGQKKLDTLAATLKGAKDIQRVEIVGYADPMGSTASNQALSERRAAAVQKYLNDHDYMNTSIAKVKAVGESQASANCDTKMKRTKKIGCLVTDRKVQVEVVYVTETVH
ncbi:MAG: OmpA family protein [Alphaproteobacteria bacterium]|nr:OmpA family protein [Alphaproteobacteria bacterium]